ncbi:hypothetical protein BsWGS_25406 [Bradybaena similaris]
MPSDHTRRKDDTWTSEELNKALKGSKGDMLRKKRGDDEGSRRRHTEDLNGSGLRADRDRRSHHRDDDEKNSRRHKDRGDSADQIALTEDERDRLRQERRAKREGVKEEKKPRSKEGKSVRISDDVDDGVRKQRRREKDEDHHLEQKHHQSEDAHKHHRSEETRKSRDGKEGERRKHREDDNREQQPQRSSNVDDSKRRHRDEGSLSRKQQDQTNRSRRHEDNKDRHAAAEEEPRHHSRKSKNDDDEEEREKRRQERREKREKEKLKDKDKDREKSQGRHKESEKSGKGRGKDNEKDKKRHHSRDVYPDRDKEDWDHDLEYKAEKRSSLHRGVEQEPERRRSRHKEADQEFAEPGRRRREEDTRVSYSSNSTHRNETAKADSNDDDADDNNNDDEYNYEEDFEDYEDDFEDEEDMHAKEENELEDGHRALNAESNRRVTSSQKFDKSDSSEASDRHYRRDDRGIQDTSARPKSFVNFVSAKQRVLDQAVASKTRKRFDDLSRLIELDVASYDLFELAPVKEYEMYIRSFGKSDTKQAYVQTGDDDIERDVQTDEIYSLSKWTQHPPSDEAAVGGEGIHFHQSEHGEEVASKTDVVRLNQFLDRVGQFLFTILDEESKNFEDGTSKEDGRHVSFCSSASQLHMPDFLKGHQIVSLSFCQAEPNYLLSIHSATLADHEKNASPLHSMYIICVWNLSQPTYPYRICASQMKITCACFSPTKASLVIAGMHDGSVAAWDLREHSSDHRRINVQGQEHLVRSPTYNTAQVLEPENHHSPVMSIVPVFSKIVGSQKDEETEEFTSGLSFQLASVEEKAIVNLWVVVEIAASDPAGSEADLGLSPGGRIKLLRSSSIVLSNPDKYLSTTLELRALNLHLHPGDLNHFYVGTDTGHVVHGVSFGKRAYPPSYWSLGDSPVSVVSLDFSPFGLSYFLAGCDDGTLHLFSTKYENPISSWRGFISGKKIQHVCWSHSRPAVFFVLDDSSTIFTFDLVDNGRGPIRVDKVTSGSATFMDFGGDPKLLMPGASRPAHMALSLTDGSIEISTLSDEMRTQEPLEEEFMASFVDRY